MKKVLKNVNLKFIVTLFIILVLSTGTAYELYADYYEIREGDLKVPAEEASTAEGAPSPGEIGDNGIKDGGKRYYSLNDLIDMYDILCSYHGGKKGAMTWEPWRAWSSSYVAYVIAGKAKFDRLLWLEGIIEVGKLTPDLAGSWLNPLVIRTPIYKKKGIGNPFGRSVVKTIDKEYGGAKIATYGLYHIAEKNIARPKEAYIIAEMVEEKDGATHFSLDAHTLGVEYSDIQYAWWDTLAAYVAPDHAHSANALAQEATAFEEYIARIGNTDPSTFEEQEYNFDNYKGHFEGKVPAPVLNFEPKYNEDVTDDGTVDVKDEVTVTWDSNKQTWTIGPYRIDYVEENFDGDEDRPHIDFSCIKNARLFVKKDGKTVEVPFAHKDEEEYKRFIEENPECEKDEEEVELLEGVTWDFNFIDGQRDLDDKFIFPHENEIFYIELDFIEGATELINLHLDFKYMNGGGKHDKYEGTFFLQTWKSEFPFNWWIKWRWSGPESRGYLYLSDMEERDSQDLAYGIIGARWYNWAELDMAEREEADHTGRFKIYKEIIDEEGNELIGVDRYKKFTFNIYKDGEFYNSVVVSVNKPYISPTFKWKANEPEPKFTVEEVLYDTYNYSTGNIEEIGSLEDGTLKFIAKNNSEIHEGRVSIEKRAYGRGLEGEPMFFKLYIDNELYKGSGADSDGIITVYVGQTWYSETIRWIGEAPRYRVVEVNIPDTARLINLVNDTGILDDGRTTSVIAYNEPVPENYRASITIRKEADVDTDETFTVRMRVGSQEFTKKLKANESWEYTVTWGRGENAPTYEVEEIDIPEGWVLEDIVNRSGTLSRGANVEVIIKNKAKEQSATINVRKEVKSSTDNGPVNDVFTIKGKISGTFEIDGESIVNGEKIVYTTILAGETKTLATVTWKGDKAPTYEIDEVNIPAPWKLEDITYSSGTLEDGKTILAVCTNCFKLPNKGRFRIEKEIVDENGEIINVDYDREFTFEIYKDGALYNIVKVTVNKPYISPEFFWTEDEAAPNITVVENLEGEDSYEQFGEISITGSLKLSTLRFIAQNKSLEKHGKVSIKKDQVGEGLEDKEFEFNLFVNDELYIQEGKTDENGKITLKVGETWTTDELTWKGDKGSYRVEEINIPADVELVSIENATGDLLEDETVEVYAYNRKIVEYESGVLKVSKIVENATSDQRFTVVIRVGNDEFRKYLKAGDVWTETFTWIKGEPAPTYQVIETDIPDGWGLVGITNASGSLEEDKTIEIKITNQATVQKSATIKIHKETDTNDKEGIDDLEEKEFTFVTRITGTFEMGGESIVNGSKVITSVLRSDETVTLDTITWRGDPPEFTVNEVNIPEGWVMREMTFSRATLEGDETDITVEVNCVNEFMVRTLYDLTMEMAGIVWEDVAINPEDKNTENSKPNGKYDGEKGIENVEVDIWKICYDSSGNQVGEKKLAVAFELDGNSRKEFPLYTDADGLWQIPRIGVPGLTDEEKESGAVKADYDVEFTYDGQTYKPTEFLVTANGNAEEYRTATNAEKSKYLTDSMAYEVESEREEFDNKFETFTGDSPIGDNGETEGYALSSGGERTDLLYYSVDSLPTVEGNTRKLSALQTRDEDRFIKDPFKMKSRTSTGELTYPFDDKVHLESVKKEIDKIEGGVVVKYEYSATYPYMLNINLGLVQRDEADLALTKDLYSAVVAVNQKLMNYKFNEYIDYELEEYQDYLDLQLKIADANIAYKLDLYESDYYYRAQVYDENSKVKGALEEFYRSIGKSNISDELDLDVFLTYKISVYNTSDSYSALVKSITDYFDEDLELVDSTVSRYIQEADGKLVDQETVIATPGRIVKKGKVADSIYAEQFEMPLVGQVRVEGYGTKYHSMQQPGSNLSGNGGMVVSDNVRKETSKDYYKATINLDNDIYKLKVGEKLEIFLTFKVRTDEVPARFGNSATDAAKSYVRLGTKANIAEIASYTTYYSDSGKVAGRVDKDSAPNNIDIENKNEKAWYEDDTDSAPPVLLDLYSETRQVSGFAWEDTPTEVIDYNQIVGNGMYDEGERLIGNLTTEMVEKVTVKRNDGKYEAYDFVWPTDKNYPFLNNKSLKEVTGYDSIILTSNAPEDIGCYEFINIPAGNYVVRFEYGNFPSDSLDENGFGIQIAGVAETKTSDSNDRKPAVYNGQDFKSTAFQTDIVKDTGKSDYASNETGYIDEEWYDFTTAKYDENGLVTNRNSDVMDNEARRLEVIAYSKILNNEITTVLASANKYEADHTELYKNTVMFADTQKINLNIENMNSLKGQKVVITDELTGQEIEVILGDEETINNLKTNYTYGKTDVNGNRGTIGIANYTYKIEAVDAGFEERSNTEFYLDKEIESITLTTNSGDQILKAIYDIDYSFELDETTGKSSYEVSVVINQDKSYGLTNLISQNKDEALGLQNFRYLYYDDNMSQSLNLEVVYRFTVLNLGEVDRTSSWLYDPNRTADEILEKANEIKPNVYTKQDGKLVSITHPQVGEWLGSIYYLGRRQSYSQPDKLVTTKVLQLIDYVDNDAVFKAEDNIALNNSWSSVTGAELYDNNIIDKSIIQEIENLKTIIDDRGFAYQTEQRNNLVLSVESDDKTVDKLANPDFIVRLLPFAASAENENRDNTPDDNWACQAYMKMIMTRSIDAEIDDDDISYDNLAEIVRFENTVGKRDIKTIAGNTDPKGSKEGVSGEFAASLDERDSSATELITFTPPTGLNAKARITTEVLIVVVAAFAILATGIVLIKKYVIK